MNDNSKLINSMTKEERHLWYDFLEPLPYEVKIQKRIGKYTVDFYIPSSKIVIEITGSRYYEEDTEKDNYFKEIGIKVFRYSAVDINNRFYSVCNDIMCCIIGSSGI